VQTYVALLRAVTPTGKNKVPMAQLRDVLTAAGFGRVRTYIQSGNVLIDTDSPPPVLAQQINILIKRHIGPDLKVIVRTCGELTAILQADPFRDYENAASCTYFVHFDEQPPDAATQAVATQEYGRDEIVFEDRTAYLYIPGTYGDSKLSGPNLEKKLGVAATMRNFNTMQKLVSLACEASSYDPSKRPVRP
jgi:uncharacterized protein (DUF1697 family)